MMNDASNKQTIFHRCAASCVIAGWMLLLLIPQTGMAADPGEIDESTRKKIHTLFEEYQAGRQPGCSVSIYRNGETIFHHSYGMANLDYDIALSDSSAFYMASISKQVTAAAAGLLLLRGELDARAPVSQYTDHWPEWAEDVKIIHLLNHTSGLPDVYDLMEIAGISLSNVMDPEDYMTVIRNGESLRHPPGEEFSYTNSGYVTLAWLIGKITGMRFSEFVNQEILEPLGMVNSFFHDRRSRIIPNRVISYAPGENGFRQTYLSNFQGVGPGGLYSTPYDWQKWDRFMQGVGQIPDEFTRLRTWMMQREVIDHTPPDYAMGLQVSVWHGMQVAGHSGSFMGFQHDYRLYPEHGLSFLTLCNRQDADPAQKNRALIRFVFTESVETFLKQYEGIYRSPELDTDYELTIEEGALVLNRRLSPNGPMKEESHDHWTAGSWEVVFRRDENGQISGFLLSTGRALDILFRKKQNRIRQ